MGKIIAIDFDGTLFEEKWPGIGQPNLGVILRAKQEKRNGATLILWTCRTGESLKQALEACAKYDLIFDEINANPEDEILKWGNNPRKVGADEYWDDKARTIQDIVLGNQSQHWMLVTDYDDNGNEVSKHIECITCGFHWQDTSHANAFRFCPGCGSPMLPDFVKEEATFCGL